MHRHTKAALLLTLGGVLAACSDDVGPSPNPVTPRLRIATSCDPSAVRATMATLLSDGTVKTEAVPRFNAAEQKKAAGDLAGAVPDYYATMNVVLDEFASGRTLAPKRYDDTQDAVEFVVSSLFLCAGQQVPADLSTTIDIVGAGVVSDDRTVCAAGPGIPVDCTVPNGQTTVLAEAGFFDAPGLLLIEPNGTSGGFANFTGVRRSEVSRIRALPLTSQANYPYYSRVAIESAPSSADALPVAVVGVCETVHDHSLQIVQEVEVPRQFVTLPRRDNMNGVQVSDRLNCADGATEVGLGAATPFGSSRFATAGWRVLRGIGSALAPRPLHAAVRFDGGIGGETLSFESWFAAVEPADIILK